MKAPLIEALNLKLRGVEPTERVAGQMILGLELQHLQIACGYKGGGAWQQYRGEVRPNWDEICRRQTGFTEALARNLWNCAEVGKARLRLQTTDGARETLALMEGPPPSELSQEDRDRLLAGILKYALREGENQTALLREYKRSIANHGDDGMTNEEEHSPADKVATTVSASEIMIYGPNNFLSMAQAMSPEAEEFDPASRRRHLLALCLFMGFSPQRAKETVIMMMDDAFLSPDELRAKRETKDAANAFFKGIAKP